MFLRSRKRVQEDHQETIEETKQRLVTDVFGGEGGGGGGDVEAALPPPEKIIALIWLYQEDDDLLDYLCTIIEKHAMNKPSLVDNIETYLPQLIQLALQWKPLSAEKECDNKINKVERMLLILAQLSTRFAIQYHWSLQNLMEDLQLDCTKSGRPNSDFDMECYANCMMLSGDLERCMSGQRQPTRMKIVPKLEITTSYGGTVTNDEVHSMSMDSGETNKEFFDAILAAAEDNVCSGLNPGIAGTVAALDVPLKLTHGGVLMFKRIYRKGIRRNVWKERYFALEESMLNCYSRERKLLRSMSLEGASIWKGLRHDKYPHSFVVTNRNTMFHLRALSEEQKSVWKHKIRDAITANSLPKNITESQKERYENYQNAKWFGRTLTDITNDLDYAQADERHQLLEDSLFELDIPQDSTLHWPWKEHGGSSEKSVFVALPHFSRLVAGNGRRWRSSLPSFQASFMVKRDETLVRSRPYERFLEEGRQESLEGTLPLPEEIKFVLQNTPWTITSIIEALKDVDTDSTEGNSTDSDELSTAASDNSGNSSNTNDSIATYSGECSTEEDSDTFSESQTDDSMSDDEESVQLSTIIPLARDVSELTNNDFPDERIGTAKTNQKKQIKLGSQKKKKKSSTKDEEMKSSSSNNVSKGDETNLDVELVVKGNDQSNLTPATNEPEESTTGVNLSVEMVLKEPPLPAQDQQPNPLSTESTSKDIDSNNGQPNQTGSEIEESNSDAIHDAAARRSSLFDNSSARRSSFFDDSEDSGSFDYTNPSEQQKGLASLQTKEYQQDEVLAALLGQYYQSVFATSTIWIRAPRVRRISRDMMIAEVPRRGVVTLAEARESLEGAEGGGNLLDYFRETHGPEESESFQRAQACFAQSLAGLFLLSYLLGAKNDPKDEKNLMIDKQGHIFASAYSSSLFKCGEGGKARPFKLTEEYIAIMGGLTSDCYQSFRSLLVSGLERAQEDVATPIGLLQLVPGCTLSCRQRDDAVHHLNQALMVVDSSADDDDDDDSTSNNEDLSDKGSSMRFVIEQSQPPKKRSLFSSSAFLAALTTKS